MVRSRAMRLCRLGVVLLVPMGRGRFDGVRSAMMARAGSFGRVRPAMMKRH